MEKIFIPASNAHSQNTAGFIFSLNRECNLRCRHCFLSSEYRSGRQLMTIDTLEQYFTMLEAFLESGFHRLDDVTFLMGGAEVSVVEDAMFEEFAIRIEAFVHRVSERFTKITFHFGLHSNFINISTSKFDCIERMSNRANNRRYDFIAGTSYEKHSGRFHKPAVQDRWEKNIREFQSRNVPIIVVWAATREDAADHKEITTYLNSLGALYRFVLMIEVGDAADNPDLLPSYAETVNFLRNIFSDNGAGYPSLSPGNPFEIDRMTTIVVDPDGCVLISPLHQNAVVRFEKTGEFADPSSTSPLAREPLIFKIGDSTQSEINEKMQKLWRDCQALDRRYRIEAGCFSCPHYHFCRGGFMKLRPFYHQPDRCAGFKEFLDERVEVE